MVESHVRLLLCAYFEVIDLVLRENSEHARELPWVAWWPSYSAPGWEPSFRLAKARLQFFVGTCPDMLEVFR